MYVSKKTVYDYGCLMTEFDMPHWKLFSQSLVNKEDVYDNEAFEYGMEKIPHVTLLYGLHKQGPVLRKMKLMLPPLNRMKIKLTGISSFTNDKYDVLKFDIDSELYHNIYDMLTSNFEYTSDYDDYKPHLTIAYLKKGMAKKYIGGTVDIDVTPKCYCYNDTEKYFRFVK